MAERLLERAAFITEAEGFAGLEPGFDRLYFGHETCPWRLPTRQELRRLRREAAGCGLAFTFVTPVLNEAGLTRVLSLLEEFADGRGEIVVNDVGLLEALSARGWEGDVVVGRLLTRQRRGGGWGGPPELKGETAVYLRQSNLDAPNVVEWFLSRYGVRRFEIDDLIQGVQVGPLPDTVRLSVYTPYVVLSVTRLCPWTFDGRGWRRGRGCPAPCREDRLVLSPEEEGAPIVMGGCCQFLRREEEEPYSGDRVDRLVIQPAVPA